MCFYTRNSFVGLEGLEDLLTSAVDKVFAAAGEAVIFIWGVVNWGCADLRGLYISCAGDIHPPVMYPFTSSLLLLYKYMRCVGPPGFTANCMPGQKGPHHSAEAPRHYARASSSGYASSPAYINCSLTSPAWGSAPESASQACTSAPHVHSVPASPDVVDPASEDSSVTADGTRTLVHSSLAITRVLMVFHMWVAIRNSSQVELLWLTVVEPLVVLGWGYYSRIWFC